MVELQSGGRAAGLAQKGSGGLYAPSGKALAGECRSWSIVMNQTIGPLLLHGQPFGVTCRLSGNGVTSSWTSWPSQAIYI